MTVPESPEDAEQLDDAQAPITAALIRSWLPNLSPSLVTRFPKERNRSWRDYPPEVLWLDVAARHQSGSDGRCVCCGHPHTCPTHKRAVELLESRAAELDAEAGDGI